MTKYATEHAGALADVTEAGTAVTFTKSTTTTNPSTAQVTTTTSTVAGHAIRVEGDPETYERLGLTQSNPVTLLFTPTTYGQEPAKGSTFTWEGETRAVAHVEPLAPDGTTILARVVGE